MRDMDDKIAGIAALTILGLGWIVAGAFGKTVDKTVILTIAAGIAGLITGKR